MEKPLISFVGMFKDEGKNIRGVLESVKSHVGRYTIFDTGSTDDTVAIIKEVFADLPGQVAAAPFTGYASTRNAVLNLDASSQYGDVSPACFQLMMSGDEYLRNPQGLVDELNEWRDGTKLSPDGAPVNMFAINVVLSDKRQFQVRVSRTDVAHCRYKSTLPLELHEFMSGNEGEPVAAITQATIDHDVSDPEARFANIWEVHIPALEAHIEEHPEDPHALMYLANSMTTMMNTTAFTVGERSTLAMKAMSYYMRRLAVETGHPVERNYARMQYLECARVANVYTKKELFDRLVQLCEADPGRPETRLMLAHAAFQVVPPTERYNLYCRAIDVARAGTAGDGSPITMSCEAEAHLGAAMLARLLSEKLNEEKYGPLVRQHVSEGMRAGGTWAMFKNVVEKPIG